MTGLRTWSQNRAGIAILAIALLSRVIISALQARYYPSSLSLPLPLVPWNDFYSVYGGWLQMVSHGLVPYRDFLTYTYTPLFLYSLYPFYATAGIQVASVPIVVSDAATSLVVYLLARKWANQKMAFAAGLAYALSPLALFYEGYLWLSSQPTTFFLLLSLYLGSTDKPKASFVTLAISILFKQEAAFILPVFLWWQFKRNRTEAWKGASLFILTMLLISLPFLLISPGNYLEDLTYGFGGLAAHSSLATTGVTGAATNAFSSLTQLGLCPSTLPTTFYPYACSTFTNPILPFVLAALSVASSLLVVPFVILAGAAVLVPKSSRRVEILIPFSVFFFTFVFSLIFHEALAYYFVPFYALLFTITQSRAELATVFAASTASLVLPNGDFPLLVAGSSVLLMMALRDHKH
jgi:4-amino-4-deoxy-L-arabinose transferase-like glycosyltransferase